MRRAFGDELEHYVYSRGNNPTVEILRKKLAALEKTADALVFSSGAAAIAAAVISQVKAGDHVVCQQNPYSWTQALLKKLLARFGVTHTFVDGSRLDEIRAAILPQTTVLYLESPNTFTFECQDLDACARLAKHHQLVTIIDNSYCSPIFQNPATFGIDLVVHSGTKYLNGHSDVVAGVVCGSKPMIRKIFESELMTLGGILPAHDASLMIRGLRTLELRVERSNQNATFLANVLTGHEKVTQVWFPFLPDSPQYELAKKQMRGCGGLFSVQFKTDQMANMENFIHRLRRFKMAVSWGGHESLIIPTIGFYQIPGRETPTAPWTFVRFYAGLEDPQWLWEDLQQAMEAL
jgi:cystathionine beta-lyase/cystathionine gamma-synthase